MTDESFYELVGTLAAWRRLRYTLYNMKDDERYADISRDFVEMMDGIRDRAIQELKDKHRELEEQVRKEAKE